jgi:hypothetical protein
MYVYSGAIRQCLAGSEDKRPIGGMWMVVVESELKLGAPVQAVWSWYGEKFRGVQKLSYSGRIDSEMINNADGTAVYGMFHDQPHPLDLMFNGDHDKALAFIFDRPRLSSQCSEIAFVNARLSYTGRTRAKDYNPGRALPEIRYYVPSLFRYDLIMITIPDNLSDAAPILFCYWDGGPIFSESKMAVQDQDVYYTEVACSPGMRNAVLCLGKESRYWDVESWSQSYPGLPLVAATQRVERGNEAYPLSPVSCADDLRKKKATYNHEALALQGRTVAKRDVYETTTVCNTSNEAILCTLRDAGANLRAKMFATAGMGLALVGVVTSFGSAAAFGVPVAVLGSLFAGAGLYDAYKEAGPVTSLLFPGESMARTTEGIPVRDRNDLLMFRLRVSNKTLEYKEGVITGLATVTKNLGDYTDERVAANKVLWSTLLSLALPDNYEIIPARLLKFDKLVPKYSSVTTESDMTTQSYYSLSDGQILHDRGGRATVYDTLNADIGNEEALFEFSNLSQSIMLFQYKKHSRRRFSLQRFGTNRLAVLRITHCVVKGVDDKHRNSLGTSRASESDAMRMMADDAGYHMYSWTSRDSVFGYNWYDLGGAKVEQTSNAANIVYLAVSGWLPWQMAVKT